MKLTLAITLIMIHRKVIGDIDKDGWNLVYGGDFANGEHASTRFCFVCEKLK